MKNKVKSVLLALGLLAGGVAIGQAFSLVSIVDITNSKPDELEASAEVLMRAYQTGANASKGVPQIQQVAAETGIRLQYIQIRQNAEIIRLLGQIAAKK